MTAPSIPISPRRSGRWRPRLESQSATGAAGSKGATISRRGRESQLPPRVEGGRCGDVYCASRRPGWVRKISAVTKGLRLENQKTFANRQILRYDYVDRQKPGFRDEDKVDGRATLRPRRDATRGHRRRRRRATVADSCGPVRTGSSVGRSRKFRIPNIMTRKSLKFPKALQESKQKIWRKQ